MKFKINKEEISLPLQHIAKVATSKVIPILSGVLITVSSEKLTLVGGDSNNFLRYELLKDKFTFIQAGSIVLPISTFYEIIRKMDGEMIEVELIGGTSVDIVAGESKFCITGMEASEYPEVRIEDGGQQVIMSGDSLKNLIYQTLYAISTREETPILSGVNFIVNTDFIRLISCDRHRLARVTYKIQTGTNEKRIIPGKTLAEIKNIVKDDLPVQINFAHNRVQFKLGMFTYVVTPLEGTYPDTDRMITMDTHTLAVVPTKNLIRALERSLIISDSSTGFIIRMEIGDKYIRIYCQNENGHLDEHITLHSLAGDSFEINYNVKYALDALKTIQTEHTAIHYNSTKRMIIFNPEGQENTIHLIMGAMK
jgi:DNA polymerase III subunit beta